MTKDQLHLLALETISAKDPLSEYVHAKARIQRNGHYQLCAFRLEVRLELAKVFGRERPGDRTPILRQLQALVQEEDAEDGD